MQVPCIPDAAAGTWGISSEVAGNGKPHRALGQAHECKTFTASYAYRNIDRMWHVGYAMHVHFHCLRAEHTIEGAQAWKLSVAVSWLVWVSSVERRVGVLRLRVCGVARARLIE